MRKLVVLMAMMLLVSCSDDKNTNPDPGQQAAEMQAGSWAAAIANFADAWESLNFTLYDSLLSEEYTFYFSPEDVAENPDIPSSWNREQEMEAVARLFADTNVERVDLTWVPGDMDEPVTEGMDGLVLVTNIYLEIDIRDPDDGQLWTNIIQGAAEFELKQMDYTTADGDTVWKVAIWRDLTAVAPKGRWGLTQDTTWGSIKNLY
jgi:hypothetical protein